MSSQNALPFITDDYRSFPGRCALDVPSVTSGNNPRAGYLFHDPDDIYNAPSGDQPPPSFGRQLLTDIAIVVGVFAGLAAAIVLSDLW